MKAEKFIDSGELIWDFGDEFLVECPKCKLLAKVVPANLDENLTALRYRKLICLSCGYIKKNKSFQNTTQVTFSNQQNTESYIVIGDGFDWYFREPLWLQIECCRKILWAYNERHLTFIENYVAAKLREKLPNKNSSLASRLPQWIKSAKNRDEILKAIGKLKDKLNGKY